MVAESRKWGLRLLFVAGVIAAWVSSSGGFVVAGAIWIIVGVLALLGRNGSLAAGRAFEVMANASLVLVGCFAIVYGIR